MIKLTEEQLTSLNELISFSFNTNEKVFILNGFSGTGKTTLLQYFIPELLKRSRALGKLSKTSKGLPNIYFTASTNKAADVLEEKLKSVRQLIDIEVKTVHSLFNLKVFNDYKNGGTKLKTTNATHELPSHAILIVDEASQISTDLDKLIRKLGEKSKIIYVGDPAQLAPVGEQIAPVFTQNFPTTYLKEIQRNAGPIAKLGEQFRKSVESLQPIQLPKPCPQIEYLTGSQFQDKVSSYFKKGIGVNDCRIITWTNNKSIAYNSHIRKLHYQEDQYQVGEILVVNSPVFNNKKDIIHTTDSYVTISDCWEYSIKVPNSRQLLQGTQYSTYAGTTFFVPDNLKLFQEILTKFKKQKDWASFYGLQEQVADVRPIHSMTAHKSQGSTFETVFIDLNDMGSCWIPSDFYRLMYVAITRASKKVYFYGNLPKNYSI